MVKRRSYPDIIEDWFKDAQETWQLDDPIYSTVVENWDGKQEPQVLEIVKPARKTQAERDYTRRIDNVKKRPFVMWDGEGWTDNDLRHRYMLLMASTGDYIEYPILDTRKCLDLITQVSHELKSQRPIHISYGFGYDVTHILREMPRALRTELLRTGETLWRCDSDEAHDEPNLYRFQYLPHKWFQVSAYHHLSKTWVTTKIFDGMTFFQSSFIKALESRSIPIDPRIIEGKANRATFKIEDMEQIRDYCYQELLAGVQLFDTLRNEFAEAGLAVSTYHGPGAVASTALQHYRIQNHMKRPPQHIELAAAHAYFGGRFEAFKIGHYEGEVYQADINSAYPYAISTLPDLSNSEWVYTDRPNPNVPGIYYAPASAEFGGELRSPFPLPWRGKAGAVGYPRYHDGGTWLWHPEAKYARELSYGYELHTDWSIRPFDFVPGMFQKRKEWKLLGKGGERALKLLLNSLYGKTAQRVGGDGGPPKWHQIEWAGITTSTCRAMIWDAISQDPDAIISVETDSVCSTRQLNLDYGDHLGGWDLERYDWITYLQSGVYFSSKDSEMAKIKTRGMDPKELTHDGVLDYLTNPERGPLTISNRQFISMTHPSSKWAYGQWQDSPRKIDVLQASGKRVHIPSECRACEAGLTMAEYLHDYCANPMYGLTDSEPHILPWLMPGKRMNYDDGPASSGPVIEGLS